MTSWAQVIQEFRQPLKAWLANSYLTLPNNGISILFLNDNSHKMISNNLYYINQIYPLVQKINPDIFSLFFISDDFLVNHLKNDAISFSHFEKQSSS